MSAPGEISSDTRQLLLETAVKVLGRDGYQALTTRAVAEEAGVNRALVNYHFGSKENLLIEICAEIDRSKYARQHAMYAEPDEPLSAKWRQAIDFYRQDLADGWTRINNELLNISATNHAVAERQHEQVNRWRDLLTEVAAEFLPRLGITIPPSIAANLVVGYWIGMDVQILAGFSEDDGQFFEILDSIGDWLEEQEEAAQQANQE